MSLPGKAYHLAQTFFSDPSNAALVLLFVASLVALVRRGDGKWRRDGELILLLGLVAVLLVGSWGPTPTQYQYYYQVVPFLVLATFQAIARLPDTSARWARVIGVTAVVALVVGLPRWYWPVIHVGSPQRWTPVAVHQAGGWVRTQLPPEARVLTTDVAIPLEAGLTVYPEYATGRHSLHVAPFLSPQQRRSLHVAWAEELDQMLAERPPDAVFLDCRVRADSMVLIAYAQRQGFRPIQSPDGKYELWIAPTRVP
jgi:hypothetical protein